MKLPPTESWAGAILFVTWVSIGIGLIVASVSACTKDEFSVFDRLKQAASVVGVLGWVTVSLHLMAIR